MNDVSVMIYSCDKYSDVWGPFFTLFFRYWECPYQVYLATETEMCLLPEVKTINHEGIWTERMWESVKEIPTEFVICMCEDMFLRRPVRQEIINLCVDRMIQHPEYACFNFEKDFDGAKEGAYPLFGKKPPGNNYKKSCQPTLWRRSILEELLDCRMNAWEWEMTAAPEYYKYWIYTGDYDSIVFDYGYRYSQWFGIQKGRWVASDVVPLFEKEGINMDLSIRGVI